MSEIMVSELRIVKYPDPILRRVCEPVSEFNEELKVLTDRMLELMLESRGVGLAAPQVGILKCLFVCNPTGEPQDNMVVINPQIDGLEGLALEEEGCLSLPEVVVSIRRAERCRLKTQDVNGQFSEQSAEGLLARIWQHENDHLSGKLILDYMDEAGKITNRRAIKYLEESYKS